MYKKKWGDFAQTTTGRFTQITDCEKTYITLLHVILIHNTNSLYVVCNIDSPISCTEYHFVTINCSFDLISTGSIWVGCNWDEGRFKSEGKREVTCIGWWFHYSNACMQNKAVDT